jgi:hypothetical protein
VLPTDLDAIFKRRLASSYSQGHSGSFSLYVELVKKAKTVSFRNVHMVDLSKCPNVHFGAAIDWLTLAFPELRTFRASHCLLFQFEDLQYLLLTCPWIKEVDLSIDLSIILPKYLIISARFEARSEMNRNMSSYYKQSPYRTPIYPVFSKVSKLTLEGRNDITGRGNVLCSLSVAVKYAYFICNLAIEFLIIVYLYVQTITWRRYPCWTNRYVI